MIDAQQQAANACRERVVILATDKGDGKPVTLTPQDHPGVSNEEYLNDLRNQMKTYVTDLNYAREVVTYEPLPDHGTTDTSTTPTTDEGSN